MVGLRIVVGLTEAQEALRREAGLTLGLQVRGSEALSGGQHKLIRCLRLLSLLFVPGPLGALG